MYIEQRCFERVRFPNHNIHLEMPGQGQSFLVSSLDISPCGMCLDIHSLPLNAQNHLLQPDAPLHVSFKLKHKMLEFNARTVRTTGTPPFIGIKFSESSLEHRRAIDEATMAEKEMTEAGKIEFEALKKEIQICQEHLFRIIVGVIGFSLGSLAFVLNCNNKYFYIVPFMVITLGFKQFRLEIGRMRRAASYIRCYIEPRHPEAKWETLLYELRILFRENEKDKDKQYSKDYYKVAGRLGTILIIVGFYRICNNWDLLLTPLQLSVHKLVCEFILPLLVYIFTLYWWRDKLIRMNEQSEKGEGAGKMEKEYFDFWNKIKNKFLKNRNP